MENLLKEKGFEKVFPDSLDPGYFYWRKNIKHHFLTESHIIVGDVISVYCREPQTKINGLSNSSGGNCDMLLCHREKTEINLLKLLLWMEI